MTRERRRDLRRALRDADVPHESQARERSWAVVRAAFTEREPVVARQPVWRRVGLALAGVGAVLVLALTPAGASVRDWIADAIDAGEENARPALGALPASGSILTETRGGAWIVRDDGSRRRLGDYQGATWSANGLFVGATDGRELLALTPEGEVRWARTAPRRIRSLDWSPGEGFRVAYVSGGELRVVAGDGTGDRAAAPRVASAAIAWQPGPPGEGAWHRLAYVDGAGRVTLLDTDANEVVWRSEQVPGRVRSLEWAADGETLLVRADGRALLLDGAGRVLAERPLEDGAEAALAPGGRRLAITRTGRRGAGELALVPARGEAGGERVLYRAPSSGPPVRFGRPSFSPDGRWILLPWPQADQWLFIRIADRRVVAVADISRQLDADRRGASSFPEVAGWCC